MHKKALTVILGTLSLSSSLLYPASSGTSVFTFLKINPGARTAGMGDISSFATSQSMLVNPAVLPWIGRSELSAQHVLYLSDIAYSNVGFVRPLDKYSAVSGSLGYLGVGSLTRTVSDASLDGFSEQGSFQFSDTAAQLGYGRIMSDGFSLGVSVRGVQETIDGQHTTGAMASVSGFYYSRGIPVTKGKSKVFYRKEAADSQLSFGFFNIGPNVKGYNLPTGGYVSLGEWLGPTVFWAGEYLGYTDGNSEIKTGLEFNVDNLFFLRGGMRHPLKDNGLGSFPSVDVTAGFGFSFRDLSLDYAWAPYGDLGQVHRVSLAAQFGKYVVPPQKKKRKPPVKKIAKRIEIKNLAVADFAGRNVSQGNASLIADFIRTEYVNTGLYTVVERNNMDKLLAEAAFQNTGCTTADCATRLGRVLNVQEIVIGSLSKLGGTYYINASLIDVETGQILRSCDQEVTSDKKLKSACKSIVSKLNY